MRVAPLGVLLSACILSVATAAPLLQNARLSGKSYAWALTARESAPCREEWRFGADDVLTIVSGREVTTHTYALTVVPGDSMLRLDRTRLTSNGLPDCQGDSDASVGQARGVYLQFLNGGGFFTCASTDGMSCHGVATEITPR